MTTAAVIAEVVKFAVRVRESTRIFRLKVLCMVESDRRLILPVRFMLSLSEQIGNDQIGAV